MEDGLMRLLVAVGIISATLLSTTVYAFVPPSAFIVRKIVDKKKGFSGLSVRTAVAGMKSDEATGIRVRTLTTIDYAARKLRSRALDEEGHELYAVERDLSAGEGVPAGALILFASTVDAVARGLRAANIPVRSDQELLELPNEVERRQSEVTSIARINESTDHNVAFVLGPRVAGRAQLWVDKDQFLPLRLIVRNGSLWDLRFDTYRFSQEFPYPRSIAAYEDGSDPEDLVYREEMLEVVVGKQARESRSSLTSGFTDDGNRADSRVRDLILKYYQTAR